MTPGEQFAELLQRPDVEQAKQRYEDMQAEIRGALSERLALPEWETDPATASEAPCGDFPDVHPFNTATFGLPLWSTKGPLDPDQWSVAKDVLREVAERYGFREVSLEVDRQANPVVQLSDGRGATVRIMVTPQDRAVLLDDGAAQSVPGERGQGRAARGR